MKVWRLARAPMTEPTGHYGGLTIATIDQVNTLNEFPWRVQVSACPPGGGGLMHSHDKETQLFYVLSGQLSFETPDDEFTLRANEAVVFFPNEPHATSNSSTEPSLTLVMTVG